MEGKPAETARAARSFITNPKVVFEGQSTGEEARLLLRAHPATQLPWILNALFLIVILAALDIFLPAILTFRQILFLNIFTVAVMLGYVWFNFLSWYFNVGIITNQRLIDIDFTSVLYKEVTATQLNKVEDVTAKSGGYFRSLFNYGNVFVQTAGTEVNIEFMNVPFPGRVVEIINNLIQK